MKCKRESQKVNSYKFKVNVITRNLIILSKLQRNLISKKIVKNNLQSEVIRENHYSCLLYVGSLVQDQFNQRAKPHLDPDKLSN
jgi:hypothetical protein